MTKVHDQPNDRQDNSSKRATIRIGVFFDGTCNNKDNVRLRESYKDTDERKKMTAAEIAVYEKEKDNDSYKNAVTNVVKLYDTYLKTDESPYIKKIYIEGIGTVSEKEDQVKMGLGLGYRYSGVRGKVFRGCYEISALPMFKSDEFQTNEIIIVFDIFGFSRGAAAVRNFAYELIRKDSVAEEIDTQIINDEVHANDGIKKTIDDVVYKTDNSLPKYGMLGYCLDKYAKIKTSKVSIKTRYMGLFDTVASYHNGFSTDPDFTKDLAKLHLNDGMDTAEKVVHLTSEDEIRKNFSLSPLPKKVLAKKNNVEISLPGVHSDVGGSYTPNYNENITIDSENRLFDFYQNKLPQYSSDTGYINYVSVLKNYRSYLIDQRWFKESEITVKNLKLVSNRANLIDKYANISLNFMYELIGGKDQFDEASFLSNFEIKKNYNIHNKWVTILSGHYDAMLKEQSMYIERHNAIEASEKQKNKNQFGGFNPSQASIYSGVPPFKAFIDDALTPYYKNKMKFPTMLANEMIYHFYKKLKCRFDGGTYELDILSRDQFIQKYALTTDKYHTTLILQEKKSIIINALVEQLLYGVLRNRYFHWSANVDPSLDIKITQGFYPHEPTRNENIDNFNRKRLIYNL